MARFRDSVLRPMTGPGQVALRSRDSEFDIGPPSNLPLTATSDANRRSSQRQIGEIIGDVRKLSPRQVDKIMARQKEKGERFGESAIALGYASADDVLGALATQFNYQVATAQQRRALPDLVALNEPFSAQVEAIRGVRSWVMQRVFSEPIQTRRALALVSPNSGDGKSYLAANLAITLAQLGGRTLLVDADLRGPSQHDYFGLPNRHGLSSILAGRTEKRVVQQVPSVLGLFVLPVGTTPPNPSELIERPTFGLLMRELTAKFDHVLVDTTAAEYGADATVISAKCGAALVLARRHATKMSELNALARSLTIGTATVAGVIINDH
jgi:protein-tyrosine kinase